MFLKPCVSTDPGEEALNHPSAWVDYEADLSGRLSNDLDSDEGGTRGLVTGIACVGRSPGDERIGAARLLEHRRKPVAS